MCKLADMRAWPLVVALAACGGGSTHGTDGPMTGSDAGPDANVPPGWTMLISGSWYLNPAGMTGDEMYWCNRYQVQQDVYISGFQALAPPGTHHARLTIDPTSTTQTGQFQCDDTIGFDPNARLIYASGLDTNDLMFPAGIAVHLKPGDYITLALHVFNVSDTSRMGTSGVLIQTVDPTTVQHEIDATFAGFLSINVKEDGQLHSQQGGCAAPTDWHVFAVWPHMHQFGIHAKLLTTNSSNVTTTVLDQPFDFTAEKTYPMNETVIHQNDLINAVCEWQAPLQTCTYPNGACIPGTCEADGYCHIPYGESASGEMCYVAMYKYPAGDVPAYGCHPSI